MSFLNKSVNYSQTAYLKSNILSPLLVSYNNFLLKLSGNTNINLDVNTGISYDYLVPNNNKKYYLLVTKKSVLDNNEVGQNGNLYNILYLFPDQTLDKDTTSNSKIDIDNEYSDCYMEIDKLFDDELLLEGYLYKHENKCEYLLTDVLVKNKAIIDVSYELRYVLLNEIVRKIGRLRLRQLNNHMTINIHPIFNTESEALIKVFKNNFVYKEQIVAIEKICRFSKRRFVDKKQDNEMKNIEVGCYTDVYNVYNKDTNNKEGILYVKGINESRKLKQLFKDAGNLITLNCVWNTKFCKWQPIF